LEDLFVWPEDRGKGYAKELISTVVKRQKTACGCTPWADNVKMQNLLSTLGFTYQYTFNDFWTFWLKNT
jgi:GNAT superfamily N-acetyltransferase